MKYLSTFGLSAKPALSIALASWCLIALFSCTGDRFLQEIDIDLENPAVDLVLESTIFQSDTVITVFFSKTQSLLEATSSSLIADANVEVFLNDVTLGTLEEVVVNSWRDNLPGTIYQLRLDNQIQAGDQIRLEATTAEGEKVSAIEQMPNAANLASATYLQDRQTTGYYYSDNSVRVVIDDPGAEENRYIFLGEEISFQINGTDTVPFRNSIDLDPGDEFTNGDFIDYPIASDLTFNGNQGSVILGTWWEPRMMPTGGDTQLWITLGSINRGGYDYDETLDALLGSEGNPFAEPAILPSGIEGGRGVLRLVNDATRIRATLE
ncbi:MAG: DUF4249 domain-containing protein [Saprospiraceae bacterium]